MPLLGVGVDAILRRDLATLVVQTNADIALRIGCRGAERNVYSFCVVLVLTDPAQLRVATRELHSDWACATMKDSLKRYFEYLDGGTRWSASSPVARSP